MANLWFDSPDNSASSRQPVRSRDGASFMSDLAEQMVAKGRKRRLKPADVTVRAAVSELLRPFSGGARGTYLKTAEEVAQRLYGNDGVTLPYIDRAAVSPAQTTVAGWAAELIETSVSDFLQDAANPSAFAALLSRGVVRIAPKANVKLPARSVPISLSASWVAETGPKAVYSLSLTNATLTPFRLAALSAWSAELAEFGIGSIESIVRDSLEHDIAAALDTALLDANAASSTRPAGLWATATSVTASAATNPIDAMLADLQGLVTAIYTNYPDAKPLFVMRPKQMLRLGTLSASTQSPFGIDAIQSGYMASGQVGCIDVSNIAVMLGDLQFKASTDATLNFETSPSAIGTPGSPNVISAPVYSAFQMDLIALRSSLEVSWAKRRTGATALVSSVTW